uniref:Uncharacterized protein n=1 Tax=Arundo donax TaxID=35708 RepID=A0A0A9CF75_ARUDO
MPIGIPTLCEHNSVVYLMSKLRYEDSKGWVVAVDRVEEAGSCSKVFCR